ncbi:MAG: head GIN domain-containing protein [Planctomycetota bacterium]
MTRKSIWPAWAALSLAGCVFHIDDEGWRTLRIGDGSSGPRVHGDGIAGQEARALSLDGVDVVTAAGAIDVSVEVGTTSSVTVFGDQNILPYVETEVDGDALVVRMSAGRYELERDLHVTVTLPALAAVRVLGSADVTVQGLDATDFTASIAGSGDIALSGALERIEIQISGSGSLDARALDVQSVDVDIAGSGDADLGRVADLRARVHGSGDVTYLGAPQERDVRVLGSGRVEAR